METCHESGHGIVGRPRALIVCTVGTTRCPRNNTDAIRTMASARGAMLLAIISGLALISYAGMSENWQRPGLRKMERERAKYNNNNNNNTIK